MFAGASDDIVRGATGNDNLDGPIRNGPLGCWTAGSAINIVLLDDVHAISEAEFILDGMLLTGSRRQRPR